MRLSAAALIAASLILSAVPAAAQDRVRIMGNVGQQVTEQTVSQTLTFQQYVEQGSLTFEQPVGKNLFYDGGAAIRLVKGLHAGATVSFFKDTSVGTVTASVPHPFFFNQPRTSTGDVPDAMRKETAIHLQASWTAPAAGGIEFTVFGGPTIFKTEQTFVTKTNITLANEVYPYDTLASPGVTTTTETASINGYNAGVDMTWRFGKTVGLGVLIRYSHGSKDITPQNGQAATIEVGGLHAGGGLRLIF